MGDKMTKSRFKLRIFSSNIMLNHHLSYKFKLIEIGKFNDLIITLTLSQLII
jgi:hypothetical protein